MKSAYMLIIFCAGALPLLPIQGLAQGRESTTEDLPPLTSEGWGPLRIGMTVDEVIAAAGEDAFPEGVGGPEPEMCDEFRPQKMPEGLHVMIERGHLTRITLSRRKDIQSEHGFGIGDRADEIKEVLGPKAISSPHVYGDPPAEYITVWREYPSGEHARGIVCDIGPEGLVSLIHAGGPSIEMLAKEEERKGA